jgi:hypothetical protein
MSAPLDLGNGLVVASLGSGGAWLSLGAAHPTRGFVELNGLPGFEEAWRGDPAAVRRYRAWMGQDVFAFLRVEVQSGEGATEVRELRLGAHVRVREVRRLERSHAIETDAVAGEPRLVQRHRIAGARRVVVRFRGRLDAHPLAEITETDPPEATGAETRLVATGDRLLIEAAALPAYAEVAVALRGGLSCGWAATGGEAQLVAQAHPDATVELELSCSLETGAPRPRSRRASTAPAPPPPPGPALHVPADLRPALDRLRDRARAYVLGCTALRVGEREVCLLTDHRILPLSWTRDAYWQAALLLSAGELDLVADHLRWLWTRCERPAGLWARSHHPSGAVKDRALQADQQLYPVLELADYQRAAGRLPEPADAWAGLVRELWEALPAGEGGLLRSDENPADDQSELPYPLSAQLLQWQAATALAGLGIAADPAAVRDRVTRHFVVEGPFGPQWAYEVDGHGARRIYQDANDLPTAFAPLTGFCAPGDPVWAATMRFALSPQNAAWSSGLGSLHTPGAWTLGDIQEWVAASLLGERPRARRALERLVAAASPDGLLPEAYDPATGGEPVRHWFAWPGAALGALLDRAR